MAELSWKRANLLTVLKPVEIIKKIKVFKIILPFYTLILTIYCKNLGALLLFFSRLIKDSLINEFNLHVQIYFQGYLAVNKCSLIIS